MRLFDEYCFCEPLAEAQPGTDLALCSGVRLGFSDAADRASIRQDADTGQATLAIDTAACGGAVRLIVALPHVSAALTGRGGMTVSIRVRMEAAAERGAGVEPIEAIAIVADGDDDPVRIPIVGKPRIGRWRATSFWDAAATVPPGEDQAWRLEVTIRPGARTLVLGTIACLLPRLARADVGIDMLGRRISAQVPAGCWPIDLRFAGEDGRSRAIAVTPDMFDIAEADGRLRIDGDLTEAMLASHDDGGPLARSGTIVMSANGAPIAFAPLRPWCPVEPATALAKAPRPCSPALEDALALVRGDHRLAALAALAQFAPPDARERRMAAQQRVRLSFKLRRFDDVVALFHGLDEATRNDPTIRARYVEACIALGDRDAARETIEDAILADGGTSAALLADLYPYSSLVDRHYGDRMRARIGVAAGSLRRRRFHMLVRCAHDHAVLGEWRRFETLLHELEALEPDTAERERLAILRAQAALLLGNVRMQFHHLNRMLGLRFTDALAPIDRALPVLPGNLRPRSDVGQRRHGALVTVIMTTYNSAATLPYAARSILDQSYRSIELIIVDDASTDATGAIIRSLAERDRRVRPVLLSCNGGTYVAKNEGLRQATGAYVTCQDSDDWAHPRKIETSVDRLDEDGALLATGVRHLRVSAERGFQCRREYIRADASSLMYRRRPVIDTIGFYDSVRAGADSEFQSRMERAFGAARVRYGPEALSIVLWSANTLSGGGDFAIDDDTGAVTATRNDYWRSYAAWHQGGGSLKLAFPLLDRPFDAPEALRPTRSTLTG